MVDLISIKIMRKVGDINIILKLLEHKWMNKVTLFVKNFAKVIHPFVCQLVKLTEDSNPSASSLCSHTSGEN